MTVEILSGMMRSGKRGTVHGSEAALCGGIIVPIESSEGLALT